MNAKHISDYYWDAILPVKTDSIANNLGYRVLPLNMEKHKNVKLMLSFYKNMPTIGYNPKDSTRDIRKSIAVGIAKYINLRVGFNDVLIYGSDLFTNVSSRTHFLDLKMAWELILPTECVKTMVLHNKETDIEKLAYFFDVSVSDMMKRLKEVIM